MPTIEIDTSEWPLMRVDYSYEPASNEEYRRFLGELGSYAADGARFASVSDMSRMKEAPSAAHGWIFSEWLRKHGALMRGASLGNAIVADVAVVRIVTSTAYWWHRDEPSFRLFDTVDEATDWCRARLERAGIPRGTPPKAPPVWVPDAPPEGAALYDLLDEPVFLVRPDGEVAFANRAGRVSFGDAPPWIADAVSQDRRSKAVPARVARVSPDEDSLFIVIPNAGARIPELPPSLERIARLLCRGLSDKEIAQQTDLTLPTVRTYVRRLYRRAGVHSRSELVHRWYASRSAG